MFSIEDGHRVVDRPITSGYRNDAMRIDQLDTKGGFNLPRRFIGPGDRSLLEQDFESALAATPNGYVEGLYMSCGTASPCRSLATASGPICSRERSRAVSDMLNRIIHVAAEFI